MRVWASGLRKLVGRPASFVSVGLLVGLLGLIVIASATIAQRDEASAAARRALAMVTFPVAYDLILSFMLGLGGLVAVIYGAAIAGSGVGSGSGSGSVPGSPATAVTTTALT